MKYVFALMICAVPSAWASHLTDLEILDVSFEDQGEYQFKVRSRAARIENYFILAFEKSNPQNVDQLKFMLQKLVRGGRMRLDADIPSFSEYPAGSFYNVSDIRFSSPAPRGPNQVGTKAKPATPAKKK